MFEESAEKGLRIDEIVCGNERHLITDGLEVSPTIWDSPMRVIHNRLLTANYPGRGFRLNRSEYLALAQVDEMLTSDNIVYHYSINAVSEEFEGIWGIDNTSNRAIFLRKEDSRNQIGSIDSGSFIDGVFIPEARIELGGETQFLRSWSIKKSLGREGQEDHMCNKICN